MNPTTKQKHLVLIGILFAILLIPRVVSLGNVIVSDEDLWVDRSVRFITALRDLDPQSTPQPGHPGIMTMWFGGVSIGLRTVLGPYDWSEFNTAGQAATAVFTAVSIVGCFLLIRFLLGAGIALASAVLLFLDPFLLAQSRTLHVDGYVTFFMFLALLFYLTNLKVALRYKTLSICSGACAGFALLSKLPGVFVTGFIALLIMFSIVGVRKIADIPAVPVKQVIWHAGYSLLSAIFVIFLLSPQQWVNPTFTLDLFGAVLPNGTASQPHEHGQFFLGSPVADPGALFYPVVTLFRMTPVSTIFVPIAIVTAVFQAVKSRNLSWKSYIVLILCLYILLFTIGVTLIDKKIGRYILPVFPALDVLAGIGILSAASSIRKSFNAKAGTLLLTVVAAFILVFLAQVVRLHPYYISYYNPVFGGPQAAQKTLLIGRGEGLELVGEYLNARENSENLVVATDFAYILRHHFAGDIRTLKVEEYTPGTIDSIDYMIISRSAAQKEQFRLPEEVLDYHRTHTPEHTIVINGIEYFYIHRLRPSSAEQY